jgi:hypothetical protein
MTKLEKFLDMFRGPTGGYDIARVLFGFGGFSGILSGIFYEGYALIALKQAFAPLEFYGGFGVLMSGFLAAAFGIKQKDKGVADAQATMQATENSS